MGGHWLTSMLIVLQITIHSRGAQGVEYRDRALFVKSDDIRKARELHTKVSQIAPNSMDQTVDHILMWLQSRYQNQQNQRLARQDSEPAQRPRPFVATQPQESFRGYLPPQPPPQPAFTVPATSSQFPPTLPPSTNPFFQTIATELQTPPPPTPTENAATPVIPSNGIEAQTTTPDFSQQPGPQQQTGQPQQQATGGFTDEPAGFLATNPPSFESNSETLQTDLQNDVIHPPHIHEMNVQCSKDMMVINVEFNKPYDGVIYSKGFYNSPECRYVNPNSGQTKYSFKVMLNSCGTHFVDEFSTGKQAYLENVLVVQNEPGIQEAWDVIRTVRCLWEGNLNKALSIALNIGMLNQEVVTFSGDTATARLDIQTGKGPFAPIASGLVKIGETMTLVVTVDGDPGFNVLVRECVARDSNPESGNLLQLTDAQGCVAKPKLFGSFQTTTNPATGSLIAYANFQAFKFPDVMDLLIECNVELCKVNCQPCAEPNQKIDPGRRRRRDVPANNGTSAVNDDTADSMTLVGRVHVYSPDDLLAANNNNDNNNNNNNNNDNNNNDDNNQMYRGGSNRAAAVSDLLLAEDPFSSGDRTVCISSKKFYLTYSFMVSVTLISSAMSMIMWIRLQRKSYKV